MKSLLKVIFVMMMVIGSAQACESVNDSCTAMEEPCAPIDLCADACDPIAD
jgi:hypothetical protein